MIKIKNLQGGFTLLEALVAVSILMVAVAAPITIAQKGLSSAVYSKDQMVASYLAQDVIEYLKNFRDNLTINNEDFDWGDLDALDDCFDQNGCEIDTIDSDNPIKSNSTRPLYRDLNGFYSYENSTGAVNTNFIRTINLQKQAVGERNDEILVSVRVAWGGNEVMVKTLIYNY